MPKFLHAADLHLDSPMRNVAGIDAAHRATLREACDKAMANLIDLALEQRVAFVVLAGDLYDDERPDLQATLALRKHFRTLREAGIRVFIVRGNHDFRAQGADRLWPDNVHEFSTESPESVAFNVDGGDVVVHGMSYPEKHVRRRLAQRYPERIASALNLGVLHTALEGHSGEHAAYAPATIGELDAKGYAYWALGHVHTFQDIPLNGGARAVYPGNLQGRHVRESEPKGAVLVTWEGTRITHVAHHECDVVRWHDVKVELDPDEVLSDQLKSAAVAVGAERVDTKPLHIVRLTLRGLGVEGQKLSRKELRDACTLALASAGLDKVALEELRIEHGATIPLRPEVAQRIDRAAQRLAQPASGREELESVIRRIWQLMEETGRTEVIEALRGALAVRSQQELRARSLELGKQRLAAELQKGSR